MLDTRHQHHKSGYHQYHKSRLLMTSSEEVVESLAVVVVTRMLEVLLDHVMRPRMMGDEYQEFETVYHRA